MVESPRMREGQQERFALKPITAEEYYAVLGLAISVSPPTIGEKYMINHADGATSLVSISQTDGGKYFSGQVLNIDTDHKVVGTTSFGNVSELKDRPTIMHTNTDSGVQKKRLAQRRVMIINQICKDRFGLSLHASSDRSPDATAFWNRLVEKGLAQVKTLPGGSKTYVML